MKQKLTPAKSYFERHEYQSQFLGSLIAEVILRVAQEGGKALWQKGRKAYKERKALESPA